MKLNFQDLMTQITLIGAVFATLYAGHSKIIMPDVEAKIEERAYSKKDGKRLERWLKDMKGDFRQDIDRMHNDVKTDIHDMQSDIKKLLQK